MLYKFKEWAKEATKSRINNPFVSMQQNQGDLVYFGVHDLANFYKENGHLPNLTAGQISNKLGKITNADHVNQTVRIITHQEPYKFGYRKLETTKDRELRKRMMHKTGNNFTEFNIPITYLQNISHMLTDQQMLNGGKLWLVVDGNTKFQQNLMKEIRKKELSKDSLLQPETSPQDHIEIHPEYVPDPNSPEFVMNNRNVLRNPQKDYDLNIELEHQKYWKYHNDHNNYSYCSSEPKAPTSGTPETTC